MLHVRGEPRPRGSLAAARMAVVAALALAAMALAACGGSTGGSAGGTGTQAQGRMGGTIVWGKSAEALQIDPITAGSETALQMIGQVYEGLVHIDDDLKPQPLLASSWEQTSPTTYVFTIRRGVRFTNGREMTVDDVIGSIDRLRDPRNGAGWSDQLGEITRVFSNAPWQVEIDLAKPNTLLVPTLGNIAASIVPIKELNARTLDLTKKMVGTGPFKVASHSLNEDWTLVRNPDYWQRGLPKADTLKVRIMPDDAARIAGLKDGSVDVANFDTPDALKLLAGQPNIAAKVVPSTQFYRLDVNSVSSIFKDARMREALSLAVDRKKIAELAMGGSSEPTGPVAPSFGMCEPESLPYGTPDLARAAQLVEQSGNKGKTISILASPTFKPFAQIAQVLQQDLQATGLKVKIEQPEEGALFARVYQGHADFDLNVSFFGSFEDPAMGLIWWSPSQIWHKDWIPDDPQLASLIKATQSEPAGPKRDATIRTTCERIARNANLIPLVTKPGIVAYRTDKVVVPLPKVDGIVSPTSPPPQYAVLAR